MGMRRISAWLLTLTIAASWLLPTAARATNHLWEISELYSNSSGTVQFVEMFNANTVEGFLNGTQLVASSGSETNTFTFPSDLADPINTANHRLLIATAGFGSLPGGVTPDYTLPANFLFTTNGTLTFTASFDEVSYLSLPTDGQNSLTIDVSTHPHVAAPAVNSPTNFAGATGSVPEPAGIGALLCAGMVLARRARRAGTSLA